jgi:hypothetical protein
MGVSDRSGAWFKPLGKRQAFAVPSVARMSAPPVDRSRLGFPFLRADEAIE